MNEEISSRIPQRPPFLFVDRVIERDQTTITTEYHVTGKEDFFQGHFPGRPILPGVILQEALFQTGALLMSYREEQDSDSQKMGVVTRVNNGKFRKIVGPGETLVMKVELTDAMGGGFFFKGRTLVNDKVVASLEFTCALA